LRRGNHGNDFSSINKIDGEEKMVVSNIIIVNPEELERKKEEIAKDGVEGLHILSDFDRTITYGLNDGKRTPTVISQLRSDPKYLGESYPKRANELFDVYHPIEIDPKIPLAEKKKEMDAWWMKHFNLIAESEFTKELIKQVVKEKPLRFRKGALEFLTLLNSQNIPLIFMSAAPGDMLIEYLIQNKLLLPNITVISNLYDWDENGRAIQIKKPVVTSVNKDETLIHELPIYSKIKDRKNVLLLGDGLEDVGMIEGFDYKNLIKIAFLNENVEENLPAFKKAYDVVLLGDQNMDYVNDLVKEILR
jgi:cytosolic 5'-nucleotidase 3